MIKINLIGRVMIICFCTLCDTADDPDNSVTGPFSNGGSERNMIVVISDLHLGANLAYTETKENLGPLENFLKKIRSAPGIKELVIAGDLLDEWFVPATINTYDGKDQHDFIQRIAMANKGVIDAFNRIIQDGKIIVTYVPGNHDLTITAENVAGILPGIQQARDEVQGLGTHSPAGYSQIAIEHGHRYNFFCAPDPFSNQDSAPGTIMPPGYFFTRIAALHVLQNSPPAGDTIPVVTPNTSHDTSQSMLFIYWKIWEWAINYLKIENKFNEKIIVTDIDGFTRTYSVNDLLPYQSTTDGYIDVNLFKGIQDTWNQRQIHNKVAVNIPVASAITNAASDTALDNQAKVQYFANRESNKRIVVFGHTHNAKIISTENHNGQKSIYANSGTWIDKNPNFPNSQRSFVVITPQNTDVASQTHVNLYNFDGEDIISIAADSLRL